jgi:methyl-accepting chemotaxis protein
VLANQIRESGKNAKIFSGGGDNFNTEVQQIKNEIDKAIDEVAEIVQKAFGMSVTFPKLQQSATKL